MALSKYALFAAFAAALLGSEAPALAQEGDLANPGVVVEIYVRGDEVEIVCPTTECNAKCRDVEGETVLLAGTFYRIGSNCSITLSDGSQLQEAIETVLALIGDEVPGGPGQGQGGPPPTPPGLDNAENNPNQNTVPPASGLPPGQTGGTPGQGGIPPPGQT